MPTPPSRLSTSLARAASVVLVVVVIAIAARISFTLPIAAVPQSLQTVAVLGSVMLAGWIGVAGVFVYIVAGSAGLPIFADGAAGLGHALGASAGYLAGFFGAALWLILADRLGMLRSFIGVLLAAVIGHIVILLAGTAGLLRWYGAADAWQQGFAPFSNGAAAKSLLLAAIVPLCRIWTHRGQAHAQE
ncbi:MAG: biotin transporter BioY [Pseudomonadota bacterium]